MELKSVKEWILNKNLTSSQKSIWEMESDRLEISRETEKAILIKCASKFGSFEFWAPKSQCVFN